MSKGRFGKNAALAVCALSALAAFCPLAFGQAAGVELGQAIGQFADKRWQERSKACYRLLKLGSAPAEAKGAAKVRPAVAALLTNNPQKAEDIKAAFRSALEAENRVAHSGSSLSAEFTDYYGDLIQAVAALNDKKSVNALAGALGTGFMVNNALAAFGDDSVDPVLLQLGKSQDRTVRMSACIVLQKMTDPASKNPIKDPEHKRKIQQALTEAPCSSTVGKKG